MWQENNAAPSYTNWGASQPDSSSHHCVMKYSTDFKWNDYACTYHTVSSSIPIHALCKLFL